MVILFLSNKYIINKMARKGNCHLNLGFLLVLPAIHKNQPHNVWTFIWQLP